MSTINIRVNKRYLSIQEGFEWNSIPSFAIITGVNGVGKTHLLQILNGSRFKDLSIYDEDGNSYRFVLAYSHRKDLSINGLIEYRKHELERKVEQKKLEDNINNYILSIDNLNARLKTTKDPVHIKQLNDSIRQHELWISKDRDEIDHLFIYDYETELQKLSVSLEKEIEIISDAEIREYANPYFNTLSEVEDYENFLKQEEQERNERYIKLSKEGRESEIAEVRNAKHSYEIINNLFKRFNFDYFEMLDPFPSDKSRNGQIRFLGRNDEIVEYNALSSGEQMIVKFIIWAMGRDIRGNRINTMLLDEPDSHLHPTMCKMMIEILSEISKDKENGGSGIRIIMTTHSPSTVAFAPEGSLYVMEKDESNNRIIRPITIETAVNILSDGIFTFEKVMSQFTIAANTEKRNLLFVEGKSDVIHLNRAMEILGYDLDVEIIDMHDAGSLASFIKSTPHKLFGKKKMVALFDCDKAGRKAYDDIKGDEKCLPCSKMITAEQCEKLSFAMMVQSPDGLEKYCPIEYLYPYSYLKRNEMLVKRKVQEFQSMYKAESEEDLLALASEFKEEKSLRPFIVDDNKKNSFAEQIKSETNRDLFKNFISTLDVIKGIIEYKHEGL